MSTSTVPILHLIEDGGDFVATSSAESFFNRFEQTTNYHTLAVFGGQGTGKSTLLNKLFGTAFATMREDGGRSQTTRGAFASLIRDSVSEEKRQPVDPLLLIIDFEGTDGMERGEDQSFEKKLALFAVACADVVVVNMFANEVGRFNAANLALLRTVFELNLNVFQKAKQTQQQAAGNGGDELDVNIGATVSEMALSAAATASKKNTLFFVIRDFTSGTIEGNKDVMTRALTQIWDKVSKPQGFEDAKIEDFFHLKFACLPHYVLQRDQFDVEVSLLRGAFLTNADVSEEAISSQFGSQTTSPDASTSGMYRSASTGMILNAATTYVFEDSPRCSTGIPIRDNVTYLSNVWDTVKNQKDLDIPSQRLLVAQLRSQEVSEELLNRFNKKIDTIHLELESGIIRRGISTHLEKIQREYAEEFKEKMQLYIESSPAVGKALRTLERTMKHKSREVFKSFALHLAKALLRGNDTAVLLLVSRAVDKLIPKLAGDWLDDCQNVVNNKNTSSWSGAATPRSPATGASGAASPAFEALDPLAKESSQKQQPLLDRTQSNLLSDIRKMQDVRQRLAQVEVSKYVGKFWGSIMGEIDAMVADLRGSVTKYQKEAVAELNQISTSEKKSSDKNENLEPILLATTENSSANRDELATSSESLLREIGRVFAEDDSAVDLVFKNLTSGFEERVRERVRSMTADCSGTLTNYFERHLFQSHDGSARHFTTKKALEEAYNIAHTGGLLLLACLTVFRGRWYAPIDIVTRESSPVNHNGNHNNFVDPNNNSATMMMAGGADNNNNNNHGAATSSPSKAVDAQQKLQYQVFLVHFNRAMEEFHIKYVVDADYFKSSSSSSGNNNNNNDDDASSSPISGSSPVSSPGNATLSAFGNSTSSSVVSASRGGGASSSSAAGGRHSMIKSFDFPNLPVASQSDEAIVATIDPGVKAIHEFNERFIMLSRSSFQHAFDMFMQSCTFTYQLQARQLERDAVAGAPTWMIVVLGLFVLREAVYIFSDPVLLIFFILIAYVFFREWIRGQYLRFLEEGPVGVTVPLKVGVDKVMELVGNVSNGGKTKTD